MHRFLSLKIPEGGGDTEKELLGLSASVLVGGTDDFYIEYRPKPLGSKYKQQVQVLQEAD